MNDSPTTSIKRGRKPRNAAFASLCDWGKKNIIFSDESGQTDEIHRKHLDGCALRGVSHCAFARVTEDKWNVLFFIGGAQHNLGLYPLASATRLYDVLLVSMEKYRKRRPAIDSDESWFNYSREQATTDLAENDNLKTFIDTLEAYWKQEGRLITQEAKEDAQAKKSRERQARKTAVAAVNTWGADLRTILFESDRETLERLKAIGEKLDTLLARGNVQPT